MSTKPVRHTKMGAWHEINSTKTRFERSNPQHYDVSTVGASIWARCERCGREFLGQDSLATHAEGCNANGG